MAVLTLKLHFAASFPFESGRKSNGDGGGFGSLSTSSPAACSLLLMSSLNLIRIRSIFFSTSLTVTSLLRSVRRARAQHQLSQTRAFLVLLLPLLAQLA